MRLAVIWLLLAVTALIAAEVPEEPWVEEEDVEEPYDDYAPDETHDRTRREAYIEDPYEEHVRVKRRCYDEPVYRVRRSTEYRRAPRQLPQYEVYEYSDEWTPISPPYEEMLAASADHYHRVYAAPGAPKAARYSDPQVSVGAIPIPLPVLRQNNPVQFVAPSNQDPLNVAPVNVASVNVAPVPVFVPSSVSAQALPGVLPVASVPVAHVQQVSDGDLYGAAAAQHHKHHSAHKAGGGSKHHGDHYNYRDGKSTKGYHSGQHTDTGNKGYKTDELHRKEYEEADGQKKKHHDRAGHKGSHEEEAFGHRGAKFDEKKGHKKGHKTKGYHNKYHKDEFHKEHKFYDDFHKSGEHHRYGKFNAKHASNESGKKKAHHVNAGHDFVEQGKKGYSNKGHLDSDHAGYKGGHGHEEHHDHHSDSGKKHGKESASHWGHAKKHQI